MNQRGGTLPDKMECLSTESNELIHDLNNIFADISYNIEYDIPQNTISKIQKYLNDAEVDQNYKIEKIDNYMRHTIPNVKTSQYIMHEKKGPYNTNNYMEKVITQISIKNKKINLQKLSFHSLFAFMPSDVLETIKTNKMDTEINQVKLDTQNTILVSEKHKNLLDLIQLINYVTAQISKNIVGEHNGKNRTVHLIMNDAKKFFPSKSDNVIFTQRSTNSAEYNPAYNKLNIFRSEEIIKVLIHEYLHLNGFDMPFRPNNINLVDSDFDKNWRINKTNNGLFLNETVTELMAQLINVVFVANRCNNIIDINTLIDLEIKFGLFQTAKILYISGINTMEEFLDKNSKTTVNESTNTVEYHIFKTILAINLGKFIELYKQKDLDGIKKLIIDYANNREYQIIINKLIKKLSTLNNNKFITTTGRMSIIELKT